MQRLKNELQQSASKGYVLQLGEVWNRYCELALKADADEAGCPVNLSKVQTHELFAVPLSLAEVNGQLHSGPKALLADVQHTSSVLLILKQLSSKRTHC